jgi:poly-gamma-glutamate capsule biosynthesis protein CapA/YwtB (metallophosphatase superfamily)
MRSVRALTLLSCSLLGALCVGCSGEPAAASEASPASPPLAAASQSTPEPSASAPAPGPAGSEAASPKAPASDDVLTISAVGDCTIGGRFAERNAPGSFQHEIEARGGDLAYPFSGVLSVLEDDDLTIANLETTLTDQPAIDDGAIRFQGKPAFVEILRRGSVELVNLANNHTGDCGPKGFDETRATLAAAGVGYFGEGHVDRRVVKGVEVVNLGYRGGALSVEPQVARDVRQHKRPDNLVIVSFHWGIEEYTATNTVQLKLGRTAVDAGADLVLGHHPHRIQGIHTYGGRRIVYSLGNFVFGGHSQPDDYDSIIYRARFALRDGRVVSVGEEIVPVSISSSAPGRNDFRPQLFEGEDRARVLARIDEYSAALP